MRQLPIAAALGALALAAPALAQQTPAAATAPRTVATPVFSTDLADVPGKQLVVVNLTFPPAGGKAAPHQHPGSVWVYVTKGEARLGIAGQPPKVVKAGESFFEPVGAIHNVSESTSATEPATGFAVMLVPKGAALASPVDEHAGH
jgi:quercetin dioxygenase-like cupin family protein